MQSVPRESITRIGTTSATVDTPELPVQRRASRFHPQPEETARWQSAQNHRAARTVAGRAADALDCQSLLEMLGLAAADGKPPHPPLS